MSDKSLSRRTFVARLGAGVAALALAVCVAACGGAPAAHPGAAEDDAVEKIAVAVTIDATAGEGTSTTYDLEVPKGATAYDALVATGVDVNASDSDYGMYVAGIDGVAGGDFGEMSGWMFEVNGEMAEVGCSQLELSDGDSLVWTYVTEFTE